MIINANIKFSMNLQQTQGVCMCGCGCVSLVHMHTLAIRTAMWSVCERGGVARSTRLCADSGNRVETAAAAAWQWRRKEWSNAKKIPPERL